ncbi:hypothetical protein [Nocardioides allogilvus]|uniref:hypothetical protein n=1 Tax=Nocardioides allogilvus TaxID=2072017 RepID=UPI00130060EE|nr:hypothetical protein [Nocardioides allogilvus]
MTTTDVLQPPTFVGQTRQLPRATLKDRYREVIKFTDTVATVKVRGLPRGIKAHQRDGRIVREVSKARGLTASWSSTRREGMRPPTSRIPIRAVRSSALSGNP